MMSLQKKHKLFMMGYGILLLLVSVLAADCSLDKGNDKEKKKPVLPEPVYVSIPDSLPFQFEISECAHFSVQKNNPDEYFCNVVYKDLKADLYCTWHRMNAEDLMQMVEESRSLAYAHLQKATAIDEQLYENYRRDVFGIFYDIQGPVASPIQIALTDSISYFFNASLYFQSDMSKADSIAPYLEYIRKDVMHLIETFSIKAN